MMTTDGLQNVRPECCAAADRVTGHRPVDGIMLNAAYEGEGSVPQAGFSLELRLKDSVLRSGAGAAFTFILDSTEVPAKTLETFRAVFIAATCGSHLR